MKILEQVLIASLAVSLMGCVDRATPAQADEFAATAEARAATTAIERTRRTPPEIARATRPDQEFGTTATVHYLNASLAVDDPVAAMARAEALLLELGGEIQHSSTSGQNANINGFLPPKARSGFRTAILELGRVSSENSSSNDITHEFQRLRHRSALLQEADRSVAELYGGSADPDRAEALALMRELTQREQQSVRTQLQNYDRQLRFAQVNLSFSKLDPNADR